MANHYKDKKTERSAGSRASNPNSRAALRERAEAEVGSDEQIAEPLELLFGLLGLHAGNEEIVEDLGALGDLLVMGKDGGQIGVHIIELLHAELFAGLAADVVAVGEFLRLEHVDLGSADRAFLCHSVGTSLFDLISDGPRASAAGTVPLYIF